jgi:hypothetical protein
VLNFDYPAILDLFRRYIDPKRSESASFLVWYLENYYRLDDVTAIDSVCDQKGDKGVDGIFVNDNDQTITIFQATITQKAGSATGDNPLKKFAGTLAQFKNADAIKALIKSAGNGEVAALATRLDLVNKIGTHELRGEFLTNINIDNNGKDFLATEGSITFIGRDELNATYISDERDIPARPPGVFDLSGFNITEYAVDSNVKAIIAPVKASELVALSGIADQSIFVFNVRGPLGRTGVNKDIVKSISMPTRHKHFPLFHNGITIIAKSLTSSGDALLVQDYFVVNGCQSLTALFKNSGKLTDNLRVLTKFIQVDPSSPIAQTITEFSNNQNGVKDRDFMSNHAIQIRLQNQFKQEYSGQFVFEIKRGENLGTGTVISNEDAGLFLWAFDLKEPWATHRKYQVFEDKHADIFGRKEVTPTRILMCWAIMEAINQALPSVTNQLFARYVLTRYFFLYIVRQILEKDQLATTILTKPGKFVETADLRVSFQGCIGSIVKDVIIDVNAEVDDLGDTFDYRDKLRDSEWVKEMSKKLVADHLKQVARNRIQSFSTEWKKANP